MALVFNILLIILLIVFVVGFVVYKVKKVDTKEAADNLSREKENYFRLFPNPGHVIMRMTMIRRALKFKEFG